MGPPNTRNSGAATTDATDDLRQIILDTKNVLSEKIDNLQTSLGERIDAISRDVQEQISELKSELTQSIDALESRVVALEQASTVGDRSCNFVISGLAESEDEVVNDKVNTFIRDDLKLNGVNIVQADRKDKYNGNTCGVIVAKCASIDDKWKVMEAKSVLRDTVNASHIRIFHDKPKWQRQHEANVRLVVNTLGTNKLYLRGSRVCAHDGNQHQQNNIRGAGRGGPGRGDAGRGGAGRGGQGRGDAGRGGAGRGGAGRGGQGRGGQGRGGTGRGGANRGGAGRGGAGRGGAGRGDQDHGGQGRDQE